MPDFVCCDTRNEKWEYLDKIVLRLWLRWYGGICTSVPCKYFLSIGGANAETLSRQHWLPRDADRTEPTTYIYIENICLHNTDLKLSLHISTIIFFVILIFPQVMFCRDLQVFIRPVRWWWCSFMLYLFMYFIYIYFITAQACCGLYVVLNAKAR